MSYEIEQLREALRFYANLRNHSGVGVSRVYNDRGRRAREALGACTLCGGLGSVATGRMVGDQDGPYAERRRCSLCDGSGVEPDLPMLDPRELTFHATRIGRTVTVQVVHPSGLVASYSAEDERYAEREAVTLLRRTLARSRA